MEFTISEKSKRNLDALLKSFEEEDKIRESTEKAKHLEHLKVYHFTSKEEFLDYIKKGNTVFNESGDCYFSNFNEKENTVKRRGIQYDDTDTPHYFTVIADFKEIEEWASWMDNESERDEGFIPFWHKK